MNRQVTCDLLDTGLRFERPRQAEDSSPCPTVLLFHGMTGTPDEMAGLAEFLHDKGYDTFVPCLSGHGQSIEHLRKVPEEVWLRESVECLEALSADRTRQLAVVGLSFGSLLTLNLALEKPDLIRAAVVLSVPIRFRSTRTELVLTALSYLPDWLLNRLGIVEKVQREEGIFVRERKAFTHHSLGALARLVRIRRSVRARLHTLRVPLLLFHDPDDHHLPPEVPELLTPLMPQPPEIRLVPGGQHELTIGHSCGEVFTAVGEFLERHGLPGCSKGEGEACRER